MANIDIVQQGPDTFQVTVSVGRSQTVHDVTVDESAREKYGSGVDPKRLVEESFHFLLEREPKEMILAKFELPAIEGYFPEYPVEIARRLSA